MTPWEYSLRLKAYMLNENEVERRIYTAVFAERLVQAEKKGKYLFNEVSDVYDYEKIEREILSEYAKENEPVEDKEDLFELAERAQRAREIVAMRKGGR